MWAIRGKSATVYTTRNLLGRPAIEALQVVQQVESIQASVITKKFPELFQGLGRLKDNYKIQLLSEAKPETLYEVSRKLVG